MWDKTVNDRKQINELKKIKASILNRVFPCNELACELLQMQINIT